MPTQVQFRRGTTGQNNTFTGAEGELTIDTSTWNIRVHDGITAGGHALSGGSSSDLAGGSTGSIPYQIATSSTGFIEIGAADTVLVSDGTTASWVDLGTLTSVGGVNADNLLVNAVTAGDRYLVVTDSTGAYTALEASTATIYNDSTGLTLNKTFNIGADIIPTSNGVYDLGSSSNRFKSLYITSSSLYIGNTHLTGTGTTGLSVNGIPVALTTDNNDLSGRNLTLTGNLTVQGTTVTVDSTVTNVSDPIFTLGTGPSGAAPASDDNKDRGIAFRWHNGSSAKTGFFGFDDSTGYFTFIPDATITGEVAGGSQGDFQASNFRGNLVGNVTGDLTGVSTTATNLAGGAAGSIAYQSAAGATTFLGIGTNGFVLTSNGTAPVWQAISGLSAGSATTATNLAGGTAGQIPYQTAAGSTTFVGPGTAGQLLMSAGTSAPTYTNTSSIYVNSAVNAEKIFGGSAGSIVFQSAAGTTAFSSGTTGQILVATTNGTPTFTNTGSIYVQDAVISTNVRGGIAGQIPIQSAANTTAFVPVGTSGQFLQAGTNTATFVSTSSMYVNAAVNAEKIFGGTAGQLVYQSGVGTTAFAGPGSAGQLLMSAGTGAPTYTNTSSIYVNAAVNAEKWATARTITLGGDLSGSVVLDGSQNVTLTATVAIDTIALGTDTTGIYVAQGATSGFGLSGSATTEGSTFTVTANSTSANTVSTIVYRDASGNFSAGTITATAFSGPITGTATTATNISGGTAGQIPIQSAAGTTAFVPVGTAGQFLQAGTNTATFVSTSSMYVASAVNAEKWATPRTFTFGGDLSGSMVVDGSQNVTFTATIAADSVALGTDTTGNYVGSGATSGFGISGSLAAEGGAFTVTANSTSANTVSTIVYRDGNGDFSARSVTLTGDLTVQGTTFTVNSTVTNVSDPIFTIGGGAGGAAPSTDDNKDRGIAFQWHNGSSAKLGFFGYDDSTGYLTFVPDATITNEVVSGTQGDIQATNFRGTLVGSISGGTAGQLVYQSGVGTTAFAGPGSAGQLLMSAGTSAPTYTNTSSIYVNAAVNAEKIFGGTAGSILFQSAAGTTAFSSGTTGQLLVATTNGTPTFTNTSSIYVNAAVNAEKWLTARTFTFGGDLSGSMVVNGSQDVTFTATIAANSVALGTDTTGDYVSNGATSGFGISGSTTGETQTFTVTANSTSANTVSTIVFRDGSGNFSAGTITATNGNITATTSATTTQTGALIVTGGVGIGNNIVAGGALFVGTPTGTVGAVGEIRATNEITAYYSSDANLKENVVLISDPIEKLSKIRGVYFDWKDSFINYRGGEDGYFVRKHDVGVIAQEIEQVLPEVVAAKSDGFLGVRYEKIIPLLIEAIKDQQRQITQLSEQVNKLVNK